MRIIDFHAHLDSHWLDRPLPDADAVVAGLDRCGVDAACVFTVMGLYGDCEAANQRLAGQVLPAGGRHVRRDEVGHRDPAAVEFPGQGFPPRPQRALAVFFNVVRDVAGEMLDVLGYEVVLADSGQKGCPQSQSACPHRDVGRAAADVFGEGLHCFERAGSWE